MTKVDKDNYKKNEQLPVMYNDAHASLRGFAKVNYLPLWYFLQG
jgi:hypothetical protein